MLNKQLKETALLVIGICGVMLIMIGGALYSFNKATFDSEEEYYAERNKEFAKARAKSFEGE